VKERDDEYEVPARRIRGTHVEKLEQIDEAIQALLDIKALECFEGRPDVRFLAAPRPRRHTWAMGLTIFVMFILLVLLLGVHPPHA
jgi:hypothetical protein